MLDPKLEKAIYILARYAKENGIYRPPESGMRRIIVEFLVLADACRNEENIQALESYGVARKWHPVSMRVDQKAIQRMEKNRGRSAWDEK